MTRTDTFEVENNPARLHHLRRHKRTHYALRLIWIAFISLLPGMLAPRAIAKNADPAESGSAYNEKGYSRDSVYRSIDGAEVNAFNFNFVFDLPLDVGLSYPENAGLSLQLRLNYNSKVWYWQNSNYHRKFLRIRRDNPFGLGFDLTLGRIIFVKSGGGEAYAYLDQSGAQHLLSLKSGSSTEFRTHDGSHIRAVLVNDSWTVSFPNGLVQELAHHFNPSVKTDLTDADSPCNADDPPIGVACEPRVFIPGPLTGVDREYVGWFVTKAYSRASTASISGSPAPSYSVTYYGEDGQNTNFGYVMKQITDQFSRVISLHLDTARGVVDSITVPAPADVNGGSRTATYLLDIQPRTLTINAAFGGPLQWDTMVLVSLSGPDLLNGQRYVHKFDYLSQLGDAGGQMASITYPSGRLVKIAYHEYPFLNGGPGICIGYGNTSPYPDPDACNSGTNGGTCAHSWGVSQIDTFLDGNSNHTKDNGWPLNDQRRTFTQTQVDRDFYPWGGNCDGSSQPRGYTRYDQLHTMIDPSGNKTEYLYRTPKEVPEENMHGILVSETYYGGGASGVTPKKMKEIGYDTNPNCMPIDCGTHLLLDSEYHEFDMAPSRIVTRWYDDEDDSGNALTTPTREVEERSNFDGFGHYQTDLFYGNAVDFHGKIVVKDYASDNKKPDGTLCDSAQALQANWLGDVVSNEQVLRQDTTGSTLLSRSDYGYDTDTGLRTSEARHLDLSVPLDTCATAPLEYTNDSVVHYTYTINGDLESEHHYVPGLSSTNAPTDVTARFTYSAGARDSGKNDGLAYYDWTRVIDHDSGLPLSQRDHPVTTTDTSAVSTVVAYDVLGRTTSITHGTDAALTITYENDTTQVSPPPGVTPVTLARVRSGQGPGSDHVETVDSFQCGRIDYSGKLNPDGSWAYKYFTYNGANRIAFESEWTRQERSTDLPGTTTDYAVYDSSGNYQFEEPFGRAAKMTDALGNVTAFRYFGLNKEKTLKAVALKANSLEDPADVKTRYLTDALGRLRAVSQPMVVSPSGNGHGPYEQTGAGAVYTYDLLGHMLRADVASSISVAASGVDRYEGSASNAQTRTWTYDVLGRQTSTTTPEAGTSTNLAWNALGQVTQSQDARGAAANYAHHTTFDAAGRPTKLERVLTSGSSLNNTYSPGDGTWTLSSAWRYDSAGTCFGTPAWTVDNTSCQYAQTTGGTQGATLDSPSMTLTPDAILTFKLYRAVRGDASGSSGRDVLRAYVRDVTSGSLTEIYKVDSTQISWPKWVQVPAIPIGQYADGHLKQVRIQFDSVDKNVESPALKGIGIGQVSVRQPTSVTLRTTTYDESLSRSGNHPNGKPTTIQEYDEATQLAIFTRELHYVDPNGRLSDETLTFDWDRDGVNETLLDDYTYDSLGNLSAQHTPYPPSTAGRQYFFPRSHGGIIGAYSVDSNEDYRYFLSNSTPGIEYNDAGGMSLIRYGNGLQEHIATNPALLTDRMWVDNGGGTPSFDTGTYQYDGARNVKQIGSDYYRYDAANRLTWSRVTSNLSGTVDLDPTYDAFGNMTAQTASAPSGGGTPTVPNGLTFAGRTVGAGANGTTNKISNTGFAYDATGNLTEEPAHDGLAAQSYRYTSDGHMARVTNGAGVYYQNALYEGDHRWFRSLWRDGGSALISVRDASGQVVADYAENSATSGLTLQKEYVRANGQLLTINSTCGPRPALALSSNQGTDTSLVWFDKTDYVAPTSSYTLYIRFSNGGSTTISQPSTLANHFSVSRSTFPAQQTSWIQIETNAACGHTGYSNTVSYTVGGGGPGCLIDMGANRLAFTTTGSKLKAMARAICPIDSQFKVYYRADGDDAIDLNGGTPTTVPSKLLSNLPCGAGEGSYWVSRVDPDTQAEMETSPVVRVEGTSCGGDQFTTNASATPGQPSMNAQYVHWDHLGSTRLVTDEEGVVIDSFKYYPFGMEADTNGADLRQKFTGHEWDDAVGIDYMVARSCRMSLARFLQPDPYDESGRPELPQSWNRYAYVLNNPVNATDPDGYVDLESGARTPTGLRDADENVGSQPDNCSARAVAGVQAGLDYVGGVAKGIAASLSFGLVGAPSASDSGASLTGQAAGSVAVTQSGITFGLGGAGTALLSSPLIVTGPGASVPIGAAATALVGAAITTGGVVNLTHVAQMTAARGGDSGGRTGGGGSRKEDIRFIDYLQKKYGLNNEQRALLHQEVSGQGYSRAEIEQAAQDIKANMPKGGGN